MAFLCSAIKRSHVIHFHHTSQMLWCPRLSMYSIDLAAIREHVRLPVQTLQSSRTCMIFVFFFFLVGCTLFQRDFEYNWMCTIIYVYYSYVRYV